VLGLDVGDSEDGAFWTAFLRSLKARGLAGAVLIEAHDEWQVAERRYLSEGSMAKLAPTGDDAARPKEVKRATAELVAT
jgi:hypothetical protein